MLNDPNNVLDGAVAGHKYLFGDQEGGHGYPDFEDFSSRFYHDLTSCGGTHDIISWTANTHLVEVDTTALTVKFYADASYKWNWTIAEK